MAAVTKKPTFVYGLVDPRDQQLRYIGKTVLRPDRRLANHLWRARKEPHKRHAMAWLLHLENLGLAPEIFTIEEIPAGGDWIEAEQFWIEYFRFVGADLCNHTIGGEGVPGYKQSPELIAKRIKRGAEHHQFGKPQHPNARSALKIANEKSRQNAEATALRYARSSATFKF